MKKIKDVSIGESALFTLLVKSATIRQTKTGKPYLSMELFDGIETIQANYWDYHEPNVPPKHSVLNLLATVVDFAGMKQLNVKSMYINTEVSPEAFVPLGNVDVDEYLNKAYTLINEVKNIHIREILLEVFNTYQNLWRTIPAARGIHHAFLAGNLKHSVDVAIKAKALAQVMPDANLDLCIAGGLLQDFGKLWTYEFKGAVIDMTEQGALLDHIAIGIAKLEQFRNERNSKIVDLLQHIIASHHGKQEYGSPVTPMFLEAWIVATADHIDAKAQIIYELNAKAKDTDKFTEKSPVLENRPMLTINYVNQIMYSA